MWSHACCYMSSHVVTCSRHTYVITCGHMWSHVITCHHMSSHVITCGHMIVVTCCHMLSHVVTCGHMSACLVQVVGEYGYLAEEVGMEAILEKVTALLGSRFSEADTYGWVVTAVTKLVSQLGHMPESVQSLVAVHLTSTSTDVQQVSLGLGLGLGLGLNVQRVSTGATQGINHSLQTI